MPKKVGTKERIRRLLQSRVGEVVTSQQIQETVDSTVTEWARRLRELREEGWQISSHNDRADLKPGQYVLEAPPPDKPAYKFAKPISKRLRAQVLERNGYTCQMCGIGAGDVMDNGRPARLHVGHIKDRSHGGTETLDNLRALCSMCNQGAKNVTQEPPSCTWVLGAVRRASIADQRAVLKWLQDKFKER